MDDRRQDLSCFIHTFLKHEKGRKVLTECEPDDAIDILTAFNSGQPLSDSQNECVLEAMIYAVGNEAELVSTFYICEEWDDYPIRLQTFAGIYWINPLEEDELGYFTTAEDAEFFASMNWDNLSSEPSN